MKRPLLILLTAVTTLGLAHCTPPVPTGVGDSGQAAADSGNEVPDAGAQADAGPAADAGPTADAGSEADGGSIPDAGTPSDGGVNPADAGPTQSDGGNAQVDAGPAGTDGGITGTADGGQGSAGQDSGQGGGRDAGPAPDAGIIINLDGGFNPPDGAFVDYVGQAEDGVVCSNDGNTVCNANQYCCLADLAPSCQLDTGGTCAGSFATITIDCDGNEDCGPGSPLCCLDQNFNTACQANGASCNMQVCRDNSDCNGQVCCGLAVSLPVDFGTCTPADQCQ